MERRTTQRTQNTLKKNGFLQRDSVEHEGYAEARSAEQMEAEEQDNARKTRTIRIYNIREKYESLHIWLNRRVPNGTHGGVGGRSLN